MNNKLQHGKKRNNYVQRTGTASKLISKHRNTCVSPAKSVEIIFTLELGFDIRYSNWRWKLFQCRTSSRFDIHSASCQRYSNQNDQIIHYKIVICLVSPLHVIVFMDIYGRTSNLAPNRKIKVLYVSMACYIPQARSPTESRRPDKWGDFPNVANHQWR